MEIKLRISSPAAGKQMKYKYKEVANFDVGDEVITQVVHEKKTSEKCVSHTLNKSAATVLKYSGKDFANDQIIKKLKIDGKGCLLLVIIFLSRF